jgi:hypothetical protein
MNIFVVPTAIAKFGFSTYVAILAIPMLTIAFIAFFSPDLDGGGRPLEVIESETF